MSAPDASPANEERLRRQRARNWAIFAALLSFVAIVFIVTIVKLKGG
ncbi:MAG: hypothetical protein ACREEP_14355 [Dongiaceae bacterium]